MREQSTRRWDCCIVCALGRLFFSWMSSKVAFGVELKFSLSLSIDTVSVWIFSLGIVPRVFHAHNCFCIFLLYCFFSLLRMLPKFRSYVYVGMLLLLCLLCRVVLLVLWIFVPFQLLLYVSLQIGFLFNLIHAYVNWQFDERNFCYSHRLFASETDI